MKSLASRLWWLAVLGTLLLAPLPLGAVNTWWSMPLAGAALVLGAAPIAAEGFRRGGRLVVPRALWPLGALLLVFGLQLLPVPAGLVAALTGRRAVLPAVPGAGGAEAFSVYPGITLETAILHLAVMYLFWAAATRSAKAGLVVVAVVGTAHAGLGLLASEAGWTTSMRVLGVFDLPEVLTPFGTYVNKNHFAGLMVMGAGAALGLLLVARREAGGARRLAGTAGAAAAFLLMLIALFASGSRGGALALVGAVLLVAVAAGVAARRLRLWPVALVLLAVAGAALVAEAAGSVSVLERLVPEGRYLNRPRLWYATIRMTGTYPVLGTGLGTFPYVFPRYQSFDPARQFTHAEGDWIQYLAETGALGAACLLVFAALLARAAWRGLRRSGRERDLAIGAAAGTLGIVLHGFLDSSLHIPANLAVAAVLFGALVSLGRAGGRGGIQGTEREEGA